VAGALVVLLGAAVRAAPPSGESGRGKPRSEGSSSRREAKKSPVPVPATPKAPPTPLDGTRWELQSYRGSDGKPVAPLEGSRLTARFPAGRIITGSAGCNAFTAGYTYDAGRLTVSQAATTRKSCPQPEMDQEAAYLAALHLVARFTLSENTLTLADAHDVALLTYQREPPPVLAGTEWRMTGYNNGKGGFVSALGAVAVTAAFGADGRLTGSSGCNEYRGKYTQDGENLTVGTLILMTRKACAPETLDQERAYLSALRSATHAEGEGSELLLTRGDDTRVVAYTAASSPTP